MKIFLPFVRKEDWVTGQSDEDVLFDLISQSSFQGRTWMVRHPLLDLAAQKKADDMAEKDYFAHTSPEGITANQNIASVGYKLPDYYFKKPNACESLSIGGHTPEDNAIGWLNSPKHRPHVYGENNFYREQECIGIGKSISRGGRNIYVFLSAPCANN